MLRDDDKMLFGKWKGVTMSFIPHSYWSWFYQKHCIAKITRGPWREVEEYIIANAEKFKIQIFKRKQIE